MTRLRHRYPRTWRFLAARFARGEYLGLHLTIGLALSLVGLWIFAGVTEDVVHHDPLTRFDLTLGNWLQTHSSSATIAVGRAISLLGSPLAIGTLAFVVAIWLAVRRHWLLLEGWMVAFLGGSLLNTALKGAIHRPRPTHAHALHYSSWSFPSGHAMESLIAYGMLAYVLILLVPAIRARPVPLVVVTTGIVISIGISRLLLGVHYFSDVMGGYAAGTLWLAACISGLEVARRWRAVRTAPS